MTPTPTNSNKMPLLRRDALQVAVQEGVATAHIYALNGVARINALSPRLRYALAALVVLVFALGGASDAFATHEAKKSGGTGSNNSCKSGTLLDFVTNGASFILGLGAGISILMFAIGALFIIFGGTEHRVKKGMDIIKNTVIGLAILASGVFIKYLITSFVQKGKAVSGGC